MTPGEVAERNVMPHKVVSLFPEGVIINLYLLSSVSSSFEIYYIFGDHLELQTKKYLNLTIENIPKLHVVMTKAYMTNYIFQNFPVIIFMLAFLKIGRICKFYTR